MSELANPHDSFFKDLLAQPEMAADFLAHYLPPEVAAELDVTGLERVKDSFIDAELQPHFSDLLYHAGALIEWQDAAALRRYAPEFEYHLIDPSAFSEAEIKGEVFLRVGLLLLKHIFSKRLLPCRRFWLCCRCRRSSTRHRLRRHSGG